MMAARPGKTEPAGPEQRNEIPTKDIFLIILPSAVAFGPKRIERSGRLPRRIASCRLHQDMVYRPGWPAISRISQAAIAALLKLLT